MTTGMHGLPVRAGSSTDTIHFCIAGVQKCGTSALFSYLRGHPQLQLAPEKEAHFFDNDAIPWARPDYNAYHRLFLNDGRLRGDATPIYVYWPPTLPRIYRYNPSMRLVLIYRCPIARAWSHWKMEYVAGRETEPFAWAIRQGRARVQSGGARGHHRVFSYVERGFYGEQLRRVLSLFPREQLLFLRMQDLAAQPEKVLDATCAFLGVEPLGELRTQRVHVSPDLPDHPNLEPADAEYLRAIFQDDQRAFRDLSGLELEREDSIQVG